MGKSRKSQRKKPQRRCASLYQWRKRYLADLRVYGASGFCARKAGISERTVQRHKKKDPKFAAAIEAAIEEAVDNVEASTFADAVKGDRILKMFILKNRRREIYGDRPAQLIDVDSLARLLAKVPTTEEAKRWEPEERGVTTGGNGRNGGNGNP